MILDHHGQPVEQPQRSPLRLSELQSRRQPVRLSEIQEQRRQQERRLRRRTTAEPEVVETKLERLVERWRHR